MILFQDQLFVISPFFFSSSPLLFTLSTALCLCVCVCVSVFACDLKVGNENGSNESIWKSRGRRRQVTLRYNTSLCLCLSSEVNQTFLPFNPFFYLFIYLFIYSIIHSLNRAPHHNKPFCIAVRCFYSTYSIPFYSILHYSIASYHYTSFTYLIYSYSFIHHTEKEWPLEN